MRHQPSRKVKEVTEGCCGNLSLRKPLVHKRRITEGAEPTAFNSEMSLRQKKRKRMGGAPVDNRQANAATQATSSKPSLHKTFPRKRHAATDGPEATEPTKVPDAHLRQKKRRVTGAFVDDNENECT